MTNGQQKSTKSTKQPKPPQADDPVKAAADVKRVTAPAPWTRPLTPEELAANGELFKRRLLSLERPGTEELLAWLCTTDFFRAPLQPTNHGVFMGALCAHSLTVADVAVDLAKRWRPTIDPRSMELVGLLHDLWKADAFHPVKRRQRRPNNTWVSVLSFEYRVDSPQLGHGEKSALYAQRFIDLTNDELLAIRWSAGAFDDAAYTYAGRAQLSNALNQCPTLALLTAAVTLTTNLVAVPTPDVIC